MESITVDVINRVPAATEECQFDGQWIIQASAGVVRLYYLGERSNMLNFDIKNNICFFCEENAELQKKMLNIFI